jgi:signal transduction histidine kinase/ligand-binding sensor domain-containing protein
MRFCPTTFLIITIFLFSCKAKKEKSFEKKISKEITGVVYADSVAPPEVKKIAPPKIVAFTKTVVKGNTGKPGKGINYFTSYSAEQGYPIGTVRGLLFDKQGVIWMTEGTRLVKYDGVNFTSFGLKNGLPTMGISDLSLDGKGNIWMSRHQGLSKYDGFAFTNYDVEDSLKRQAALRGESVVTGVNNDKDGNIWFSVKGKGISKYDGNSFSVFSTHQGLPSDSIHITMIDKEGKLWLTSWDGVSGIFDGKTYKAFTKDDWTKGKTLRVYLKDSKGNIWYLSSQKVFSKEDIGKGNFRSLNMKFEEGIFKYDGKSSIQYTSLDGLPSNNINEITEDASGNIWFATGKGVCRYDGTRFTNYTTEHGLSNDYSQRIKIDPSGNIWVVGLTGISKFNGTNLNQYTAEMGFNGVDIGRVEFVNDSLGNLWFTVKGGIGKYDGHEFTYYTKPATNNAETGNSNISYGSILLAKDGSIWFSTGFGESCYRFDGKTFLSYPELNANGILQDSKGYYWFSGYGNGVLKFDGKEYARYTTAQGMGSNNIFNIAEDPSGNIWLGRRDGFIKYDGEKFTNYNFIKGFGNGNSSRMVVADRNGRIWFASDSGLIKFDGQSIYNFGIAEGLTSGSNSNIVEDTANKKIWFETDFGLSAINTQLQDEKTGKEVLEQYNFQTGFPELSKDFNGRYVDKNGVLWLSASNKTLIKFDYRQFKETRIPKLLINNVQIGNENISWYNLQLANLGNKMRDSMSMANELGMRFNRVISAAELEDMFGRFAGVRFDSISRDNPIPFRLKIPFRHNSIGFDFGIIDPNNANQVQYQYILEGYDKTWSKPDHITKASFGNISEGNYTFRVKALRTNGQSVETSYEFTVLPPWYRTWWAYILYILVAGTAIFTFIRWRTKALQKEKLILEEKVTTRTSELKESLENLKATQSQLIQSEKMASLGELTAGIAHEIQNPLNFVNNFSEVSNELIDEMKDEIKKGNYDEVNTIADDVKQNLEKINHHGKRADAIVKGMLQHSRSSNSVKEPTDINALCDEYLRLAYHGLRAKDKSFNATMKTDLDESIGKINIIPQDIGRVVLNLINNAFYAVDEKKKKQPTGYEPAVSVNTKKLNGKVEISVKDNGNGIPKKLLDKVFQPFFTTKPTGQGTGLGLSLSYDVVKAHGGELKVETEEGKGSTFIILLTINTNNG